ncbi:MAG: glycosyltransferase family 39 protein [Chloroflexi bacterium]|nr:glycosyltransferase family 39 protein [Chloroflexota bacterium]
MTNLRIHSLIPRMNRQPTSRHHTHNLWPWLMVALLLLAFALRLHRAGDRAVWWDEGWSVWVARQSLAQIAYQTGHDVHPPVYFWLLHLWRAASGDSEFGLRMFSAVFGTLTIAATYLLGRATANKPVGFLAALFLTLSRFHIVWSQEMRMYALAGFLAVLGTWAARRVWARGKPADYALYIFCMTAGLLTLYLFFPIPVAINIAWLWELRHAPNRRQSLLKWGAAQLVILGIVGAWLVYALPGFLSTSSATPIAVWDFLKIYWTVLVTGIPLNVDDYARLTLPVLAVFATAVLTLILQSRRRWQTGRDLTLFLSGLLIPLAVVAYVTIPKAGAYAPPFDPRYLVIFTGYYVILLAWGLGRLGNGRRWPLTAALAAVVIGVSLAGMRGYYNGRIRIDDYTSLGRALQAYAHPGDAVVLYSDRDWPIFAYHYADDWIGLPHLWDVGPQTAADFLTPLWESSDGLWLVVTPYAGVTDPGGHAPAWLAERATAVREYPYGDKALRFYARTPKRAAQMETLNPAAHPRFPADIIIAPGVTLTGFDQASRDYASGDTVHLGVYWQRAAAAKEAYAEAEVGLMDENGRAWQWEYVPLSPERAWAEDGRLRDELALLIPPEAPAGAYTFYVFNNQGETSHFGGFRLRQRQTTFVNLADVTISRPLDVAFANGIRLLGYDIANESVAPGGALHMTLYWQTDQAVTQPYKVFTHLLGEVYNAETDNFLWGQQDNEPVNGRRPTTGWRPGEVIIDAYAMPIAANAPAGVYTLEIGLYDPITGARLPVVDESGTAVADHVVLETAVTVTPLE